MSSESAAATDPIEIQAREREAAINKLQKIISKNLPGGFVEIINNGTISYVIPHSLFPQGYHCDPKKPLPFISIASQKKFIAVYHMGLYADDKLLQWFINEYPKHCKTKLDMGKSCIRFMKTDQIPYDLIAELSRKVSAKDWINTYLEKIKTR